MTTASNRRAPRVRPPAGRGGAGPPAAKRVPRVETWHGDERVDEYSWLRDGSDPEVIAHLEAENAYALASMKPTEPLQRKLYREMLARVKETDLSVPYRHGPYSYYVRTERGKQYAIYCRRADGRRAPEEVTLDLNESADGGGFTRLGLYAASDDGGLLCYSIDSTGTGRHALYVKDLRSARPCPAIVEGAVDAVWAADGRTLFYTTEHAQTRRCDRLFRHVAGSRAHDLVYEEKDELYDLELRRSRDRRFIFVASASKSTTEVRFVPADRPDAPPEVLSPRREGHRYYAEHHGGYFYIRTNRRAKNFRIVRTPAAAPRPAGWKSFLPHRNAVKLEQVEMFAGHCVVIEREEGLPRVRVIDLRGGGSHRIEFGEPVYAVASGVNAEFDTDRFRLRYQSLVTPPSVFDYGMGTRSLTLLKKAEVLGGYDAARYASERVFAPAEDGTRVPVSLVYRKGLRRNGRSPVLLYGYGAYGVAAPASFSSARLSLLDRGVVYAVAHVRGGGEMGEEWHEAGKLMSKRNTFTDFIAAAEHLVAEKYTAAGRLVVQGDSAGGLLMGAVANMRPELFRAAVMHVPFVDVLNTMLDDTLPLTAAEYLEWGDPHDPRAYAYMKSYSPYENIRPAAYPATLVKTSLRDSLVLFWGPVKYAARLRATKTDARPLLCRVNTGAGHGGPSGRYDALRELAFDYAFILDQVGKGE